MLGYVNFLKTKNQPCGKQKTVNFLYQRAKFWVDTESTLYHSNKTGLEEDREK